MPSAAVREPFAPLKASWRVVAQTSGRLKPHDEDAMGDTLAELLADITEAARTIGTLLQTAGHP